MALPNQVGNRIIRRGFMSEWSMFFKLIAFGISDNKIYHYHLNLRGSVSTRRLTRLPSIPKNDAKFRIYIQ
ncbi:hypothetical protein ES332_A02G081000v1 [Gossypium tomentosum]|uniref:Uncharacterized protein n=1 Tax=Gossypium tomentosum TaxID=34277 RepID=A0A5D2RFF0_GOSTO|nr:hypothetical protein ES332_A02G081000v1 [Gossypium tomentosum]